MSRSPLTSWYASPFTGLFRRWGPIPLRPHDPAIPAWSGLLPRWGPDGADLAVGGVGVDLAAAQAAALGEAVERWQARALPGDGVIEAAFDRWPLEEPAVDPGRWVLFHPEQYAMPGFPFEPLSSTQGSQSQRAAGIMPADERAAGIMPADERAAGFMPAVRTAGVKPAARQSTAGVKPAARENPAENSCQWVCCRVAGTGEPCWAPAWQVFLNSPSPHGPSLSTGLSAGKIGDPVLLRGLQEVIERDALVGAWWGSYPLEEHDTQRIFSLLAADLPSRLSRPNLRYRCYQVQTPYSAHVTIVTLTGDNHEGFCFSAGSACRETRAASWTKAILEAGQGRHYVRYLRRTPGEEPPHPQPLSPEAGARGAIQQPPAGFPTDFAGHALYYSLFPDRLRQTVLEHAVAATVEGEQADEGFSILAERLGRDRPVLFRLLTPPGVSAAGADWFVLRVLVPGLQPLHGHHGYPFLGGPLWSPRGIAEYAFMPPHPFP